MHDGVTTVVQLTDGQVLEFFGMVFDIQQGGNLIMFGSRRPLVSFAPGQWASVVLQGFVEDDYENEESEEEDIQKQFSGSNKKYH